MNPFGVPVTEETVKEKSWYRNREVTSEDAAREAMREIDFGGKNIDALQFALNLKSRYGNGVSAMILVYNATGSQIELMTSQNQDWSGLVFNQQPPNILQNGQWLAFLHVKPTALAQGSKGARVFRGRNRNGETRDFLVSWNITWNNNSTHAYTEVRGMNHFPQHWAHLQWLLDNSGRITRDLTDPLMASTVSIGGATTSECIVILQHKFSPLPDEM